MPNISPSEIMTLFPVGKIMELSADTRQKILFLTEVADATDYIQKILSEKFPDDEEISNKEVSKVTDKALNDEPLKTMLSITMGAGWNHPLSIMAAHNNVRLIKNLIWALVYVDLVGTYKITRKTWLCLKLCLLEKPVAGGVLVQGYEFSPQDIEPNAKRQSSICPDYPPPMDLENEK